MCGSDQDSSKYPSSSLSFEFFPNIPRPPKCSFLFCSLLLILLTQKLVTPQKKYNAKSRKAKKTGPSRSKIQEACARACKECVCKYTHRRIPACAAATTYVQPKHERTQLFHVHKPLDIRKQKHRPRGENLASWLCSEPSCLPCVLKTLNPKP